VVERLFAWSCTFPAGIALNITEVKVPEWVEAGSSADLRCSWTPEQRQIWALRWYQGLNEIYRWTPSKEDPKQIFKNPHLTVNVRVTFSFNKN
jgi:hypothetical protein